MGKDPPESPAAELAAAAACLAEAVQADNTIRQRGGPIDANELLRARRELDESTERYSRALQRYIEFFRGRNFRERNSTKSKVAAPSKAAAPIAAGHDLQQAKRISPANRSRVARHITQ